MNNFIKKPVGVKKVWQKAPDVDGFVVSLDDGKVVEISRTEWNTEDNKRRVGNELYFSLRNGDEIYFSQERERDVNGLFRINS